MARPTALLAVVGAVLIVAGLRRRAFRQAHLSIVAYALVAVGLFAAVHLSFALGDLTTPNNARLATVYLGPLALVAAVPLHRLWRRLPARARAPLLAVAAVVLLAAYLPVARRNQLMGAMILPREYERNLERLRAWPPHRLLVVANRPGLYVAQDVAAIYPRDLVRRWPDLHDGARDNGERIVVIQHVDLRTGAVDPTLPSALVLRTVDEYALDGRVEVRISEVALEPMAAQAGGGPAGYSCRRPVDAQSSVAELRHPPRCRSRLVRPLLSTARMKSTRCFRGLLLASILLTAACQSPSAPRRTAEVVQAEDDPGQLRRLLELHRGRSRLVRVCGRRRRRHGDRDGRAVVVVARAATARHDDFAERLVGHGAAVDGSGQLHPLPAPRPPDADDVLLRWRGRDHHLRPQPRS